MTTLKVVKPKEAGKAESAKGNPPKADDPKNLVIVPPVTEKTSLADICSAVSKDKGNLFDVTDIESEMISFIGENASKEAHEIDNLAVVISKGRVLYQAHRTKLEKTGNIIGGIAVKGKILGGMVLNIEQKLLRKSGKQWIIHYKQTYGAKSLRSAQDYMGLAEIDNILDYVAVGKERLVDVRRAMKALGIEGDDPISTFLKYFDIPFHSKDLKGGESIDDLKAGIDYAVATTKIAVAEGKKEIQLDVNLDLVKRLIGHGIKVNNSLVNDLFIIKREDHDVNHHLEGLCNLEGPDEDILSPIKKVERLPSLVAGIKVAVAEIVQKANLADRINPDDVDDLENSVRQMKTLLENRADTEQ